MLVTALQRSLKTRITLWVLALLLAGMWALVLLAQQRLRQELQLQLQERQMAVATLLGQEMEQALQERTQALQSVAAVLSAALERYPDDLPERLTSRTVLQQMFTGGTFVTDSAGSVLTAYPHTVFHTASALHQGFSSYVQAALGGLTVISHPIAGPDGQYPIVALATPVRGMDGRVLGTLVGLVNLSQPNFVDAVQLLSERQLGDYYVIARQTRTIVAASDRRRVLEALPPVGVNPEMDRFIRGALQESTVAPMGKVQVLASTRHVALPDWMVVVVQPTAQAFAPLQLVQRQILAGALALTLLVVGTMWWLLRRELQPLERIASQLSAMAQGQSPLAPLTAPRPDEISLLVRGFNHLLAQLRQRQQALGESEERYRQAFMTSHDALDITRLADGQILDINHSFERLFGWPRSDVLGQSGQSLQLWPDPSERTPIIEQALAQGYSTPSEQELLTRDGQRLTVRISASLLHLDGQPCLLWAAQDITAYRQASEQIERLTHTDSLTGLCNAQHLSTLLAQAQTRTLERRQLGALLCLDLDDFKSVNDAWGRDQGDALLRQLAQRISTIVRPQHPVARLGADQFLVLLENLPPVLAAHDAQHLAERLQKALAEPLTLAGVQHHASVSIGILVWGESYQEPQELLRRVVLALNQAKNAGAGSVLFFEPQMQDQVSGRARLQRSLREALQKQSFALHYQPQLDTAGQVVGVEALLRWHLPGHGMVSPAEFIPLAEKTGLIVPLGRWVLHQACSQLAAWAQEPARRHLTMAVNVSADQFRQEDFVQQVYEVLHATGAPAAQLKLELTESLMVHDTEQVIERMNALRQLGLRFSLDDFGTGFSSLAYLKLLPLDQLKIDQSFVRDLLDDANDAVIAQSIIGLGLSLGLEVIAEGVETQAHRDLLHGWGCRYYQGYFFSRPLPLRELEDYLRAQATAAAANT